MCYRFFGLEMPVGFLNGYRANGTNMKKSALKAANVWCGIHLLYISRDTCFRHQTSKELQTFIFLSKGQLL